MAPHNQTCVLDDARVTSWFDSPDFLPPRPTVVAHSMFVQRHAVLVMGLEDSALVNHGGTNKQWRNFAGCSAIARSLLGVCCVMFGPIIIAEAHVACAGAHPTTLPSSRASFKKVQSHSPTGLVLRGSHACMFYDSQRAVDVCLGSVQSRTNQCPSGFDKPTPLVASSVTHPSHIAPHLQPWSCAWSSSPCLQLHWQYTSHSRFNTSNLATRCIDLVESQHR